MARISTRQLASLCHRMALSLRAGTDLLTLLDTEARQGTTRHRDQMTRLAEQVSRGATLAEAFRATDDYLPNLTCDLVEVGEETGRLESVFERLADHYRHVLKLRSTFLAHIAWPVMELVLGIVVIGILIFVLGAVGSDKGVFGLSGGRGLMIYLTVVGLTIAALALAGYGLLREWFGPWPLAALLRVPVVGTSIQTMALARMAWTLSLTLDAGIEAHRALRLALNSTRYPHYLKNAAAADAVIARGGQFHEALRQMGSFPDEFVDALQTAELSGTEGESLARLSLEYQERAEVSSKALAVAAGVAVGVVIAIVFIFVLFSLVMDLYLGPINEALEFANDPT